MLHFGTRGALEFMPGKQTALSGDCWPDRLISDLPNLYLYSVNNPSEGTIAKRRANATLVSYLTPTVAEVGLYRGFNELKSALTRWRVLGSEEERLDLASAEPAWSTQTATEMARLSDALLELEYTLIPHGMHVFGRAPTLVERTDMLIAMAQSAHNVEATESLCANIVAMLSGTAPAAPLSE